MAPAPAGMRRHAPFSDLWPRRAPHGHHAPGVKPRDCYITVSTCATPEDHARGIFWTDRYGNPRHRIDKIGVLVKGTPNPFWHR